MFDKDYVLKGKHATYAKFLCATTEKKNKEAKVAGVFRYVIDLYKIAPLVGLAYDKKADEDKNTTDTLRIFTEQIISNQDSLISVFRLIMLTDRFNEISDEVRIDRAFKEDEDKEKLAKNMELFNSYVLGGIEWLYEQFTDNCITKEDYLGKIDEVVENYKLDFFNLFRA